SGDKRRVVVDSLVEHCRRARRALAIGAGRKQGAIVGVVIKDPGRLRCSARDQGEETRERVRRRAAERILINDSVCCKATATALRMALDVVFEMYRMHAVNADQQNMTVSPAVISPVL